MKTDAPHILLINPWICDFAAYDFWAKPLGLLQLAAILRMHGFRVSYIDCLDRFHPHAKQKDPLAKNGRGPYLKTRIPAPKGLEALKRRYCRYGILPEWFEEDLRAVAQPDLILITCLMTYWYPGAFETIGAIRRVYSKSPIVLGGIYATLCQDHAVSFSGADQVFSGPAEENLLNLVARMTGFRRDLQFDPHDLNTYPYPAFDLGRRIGYIPLLTSKGCPFTCAYCASPFLNPNRMLRDPAAVVKEMRFWHETYGVTEFAFYDDALLVDAEVHAIPLLERIIASGMRVRLHTPNAVHIRGITKEIAGLMFQAGVKTLRLGLETFEFENRRIDRKVKQEEFLKAASCLLDAGFEKRQIGAYLLAGLPGQSFDAIISSIAAVKKTGITPVLAYYSPIPHTALWNAAKAASPYDLESDPVFTNNAIMPCASFGFDWSTLTRLKEMIASESPDVNEAGFP